MTRPTFGEPPDVRQRVPRLNGAGPPQRGSVLSKIISENRSRTPDAPRRTGLFRLAPLPIEPGSEKTAALGLA
jgi:hypothetical protein